MRSKELQMAYNHISTLFHWHWKKGQRLFANGVYLFTKKLSESLLYSSASCPTIKLMTSILVLCTTQYIFHLNTDLHYQITPIIQETTWSSFIWVYNHIWAVILLSYYILLSMNTHTLQLAIPLTSVLDFVESTKHFKANLFSVTRFVHNLDRQNNKQQQQQTSVTIPYFGHAWSQKDKHWVWSTDYFCNGTSHKQPPLCQA